MATGESLWRLFTAYLLCQVVLVPVYVLVGVLRRRPTSPGFLWALQRVLIVLSLAAPALLLAPLPARVITRHPSPLVTAIERIRSVTVEYSTAAAVAIPQPAARVGVPMSPATDGAIETARPVSWRSWAGWVLLAASLGGTVLLAAATLLQGVRLRLIARGASRSLTQAGVPLLSSAGVSSPFCAGAIRPRIYLPASEPDGSLRDAMVAHELEHIRAGHLLWAVVDRLHSSLAWFNPLSVILSRWGYAARELCCDRATAIRVGTRLYADALVTYGALKAVDGLTAATAWTGAVTARERIVRILDPPASPSAALRLGAAGLVMISLALASGVSSCRGRGLPEGAVNRVETTVEEDMGPWQTIEFPVEGLKVRVRSAGLGSDREAQAASDIANTLPFRARMLRHVYQSWLLKDPAIRGSVSLSLRTSAGGQVRQAVAQSRDIRNTEFLRALETTAMTWKLRETEELVEVDLTVPLELGLLPGSLSREHLAYVRTLTGSAGQRILESYSVPGGNGAMALPSGGVDLERLWESLVAAGMESYFTVQIPGMQSLGERPPNAFLVASSLEGNQGDPSIKTLHRAAGEPQGSVILRVVMDEAGEVETATIVDTDMADQGFAETLRHLILGWRYSPQAAAGHGRLTAAAAPAAVLDEGPFFLCYHFRRSLFPGFTSFQIGGDWWGELQAGNGHSLWPDSP